MDFNFYSPVMKEKKIHTAGWGEKLIFLVWRKQKLPVSHQEEDKKKLLEAPSDLQMELVEIRSHSLGAWERKLWTF